MMKRRRNVAFLLALMMLITSVLPAMTDVQAASKYTLTLSSGKSVPGQIYTTQSIHVKTNKGTASYSSSNSKILKVSSSGTVTAVTTGTATVYAKIKKKVVAKKSIKVIAPKLTLTNGKGVPSTLYLGGSISLKTTGVAATYSSSNSKVLKVSASGTVMGVSAGTATVYAKANKKVVAKKSIKVKTPQYTLTNGSAVPSILYTGQGITLKTAGIVASYSSSNTAIATVNSSTGAVTPKAPGKVMINVKNQQTGYLVRSITFTVRQRATKLTASKSELNLKAGTKATVKITKTPLTSTDVLSYTSSNTAVAKVNATTGEITALKNGSAVITVYAKADSKVANSNSGNKKVTINVYVGPRLSNVAATTCQEVTVTFKADMAAYAAKASDFVIKDKATGVPLVVNKATTSGNKVILSLSDKLWTGFSYTMQYGTIKGEFTVSPSLEPIRYSVGDTVINVSKTSYKQNTSVLLGTTRNRIYLGVYDAAGQLSMSGYETWSVQAANEKVLLTGEKILMEDGNYFIDIAPVSAGTTTVKITKDGQTLYSLPITVLEERKVTKMTLSSDTVTLSNATNLEERKTIKITMTDQYGKAYENFNEPESIKVTCIKTSNSVDKSYVNDGGFINLEFERMQFTVCGEHFRAGSYIYEVTYKNCSARFTVIIKESSTTGITTYATELSANSIDTTNYATEEEFIDVRGYTYKDGVKKQNFPVQIGCSSTDEGSNYEIRVKSVEIYNEAGHDVTNTCWDNECSRISVVKPIEDGIEVMPAGKYTIKTVVEVLKGPAPEDKITIENKHLLTVTTKRKVELLNIPDTLYLPVGTTLDNSSLTELLKEVVKVKVTYGREVTIYDKSSFLNLWAYTGVTDLSSLTGWTIDLDQVNLDVILPTDSNLEKHHLYINHTLTICPDISSFTADKQTMNITNSTKAVQSADVILDAKNMKKESVTYLNDMNQKTTGIGRNNLKVTCISYPDSVNALDTDYRGKYSFDETNNKLTFYGYDDKLGGQLPKGTYTYKVEYGDRSLTITVNVADSTDEEFVVTPKLSATTMNYTVPDSQSDMEKGITLAFDVTVGSTTETIAPISPGDEGKAYTEGLDNHYEVHAAYYQLLSANGEDVTNRWIENNKINLMKAGSNGYIHMPAGTYTLRAYVQYSIGEDRRIDKKFERNIVITEEKPVVTVNQISTVVYKELSSENIEYTIKQCFTYQCGDTTYDGIGENPQVRVDMDSTQYVILGNKVVFTKIGFVLLNDSDQPIVYEYTGNMETIISDTSRD